MLLFCSRSLFLSNRSSFFYSRSLFLTGLAGSTLRLNLFTLAFLCISSLLVSLLSLTLLNTLSDSSAASVKDYLNTILRIIVSGNDEVDIVRIRVGVNDTEHGDTKTVSLTNSNLLLQHVNNEECARQTSQVSDRTKVLLQLCTLTGNLQQLALREV